MKYAHGLVNSNTVLLSEIVLCAYCVQVLNPLYVLSHLVFIPWEVGLSLCTDKELVRNAVKSQQKVKTGLRG